MGCKEKTPTHNININELVLKTIKMLTRTRKEIVIHQRLQKYVWPVSIDCGRIANALLDLFIVSRQAMPVGKDIFVETCNTFIRIGDSIHKEFKRLKGGNYVCISVTDTGGGINPDLIKYIFDPFPATKKTGTHYELFFPCGINQGCGETIIDYGKENDGATFKIFLQASTGERNIETPLRKRDTITSTETVSGSDDDKCILNTTSDSPSLYSSSELNR